LFLLVVGLVELTLGGWLMRERVVGVFRREKNLLAHSPGNVNSLELVETSEYTGTSNTTQNVSSSSLHHGHESLVLEDLSSAIQRVLVLDTATGSHHHSSSDGINGVGHKTRGNGDGPAEEEGCTNSGSITKQNWLQRVVQTEVHTSINEDTDSRDDETSVQTLDTVRLESLCVHINKTIELSLSTLAFSIISQSGTSVVKRVYKEERHGTSKSTASDVGAELHVLWGILGGSEHSLHCVLEGKVKSLGGEISEHISQVSSQNG